MYNAKAVITGIVIFVVLFSSPFWVSYLGQDYKKTDVVLPKDEKNCIEDVEFMRAQHMRLLNEWRDEALRKLGEYVMPRDMVSRVSCKKRWMSRVPNHKYDVVAVDCGIKYNIIRLLNRVGCNVTVMPYNSTVEEIMAFHPDGLVLSNGPGNPEDVTPVIELVKQLRGRLPIFGICMGHQLISLAYGARTFKMKFGHRGANHPVKNLVTGKLEITSQNHSYAVDVDSLAGTGLTLTHVNLLDGTAEGVECAADRVFSMQYHPESASGPQDSAYLFKKFTKIMEDHKNA